MISIRAQPARISTTGMAKILIVEDDPMIAEIYQKKFISAGFEVAVAENGKKVLEEVENSQFDLVLLDMVLPEMSGLEILKKLKSGNYNPSMKVIIFSNLSEKSDRDEAMQNGADGFIGKTQYNPSELVTEVRRILHQFGEEAKNEERLNNGSSGNGEKRKKILFIEDEEIFIDILGKKLQDEGYEVEVSKNGNWALKAALENNFDLIITDMVLPNMNGEELVQKLKADDKTKNIPIIVLSASVSEKDLERVKELGVLECYLKTHVIPSELAKKVSEILK